MFCQGHFKLRSRGQENPFKLCFWDESQVENKTYADKCRCYLEQSCERQWRRAQRCARQENSRLWEMAGWLLRQRALRLSYQQAELIASQTSMSLLSFSLWCSLILSCPLVPSHFLSHALTCPPPPSRPALSSPPLLHLCLSPARPGLSSPLLSTTNPTKQPPTTLNWCKHVFLRGRSPWRGAVSLSRNH